MPDQIRQFLGHSAWIQWQSWQAIRALDEASLAEGSDGDAALRRAEGHARQAVALGLAPDHRLHILLSRVAQRRQDVPAAEAEYRNALHAEPRSHALQAEMGEFLVAHGQPSEGWSLLERALAGSPGLERARQGVGLRMLEQGRGREAIAVFSEGERRDPGDPAWPAHLGNAYAAQEDLAAAEQAWNRALVIQPGYRPALRRLAELRGQQGRYGESLDIINELLADTPKDGRLHELAARAALGAGQPERARRHLDLALRFLPADPSLLQLKALIPPPAAP
jgi:predicted Zn-dependent protease